MRMIRPKAESREGLPSSLGPGMRHRTEPRQLTANIKQGSLHSLTSGSDDRESAGDFNKSNSWCRGRGRLQQMTKRLGGDLEEACVNISRESWPREWVKSNGGSRRDVGSKERSQLPPVFVSQRWESVSSELIGWWEGAEVGKVIKIWGRRRIIRQCCPWEPVCGQLGLPLMEQWGRSWRETQNVC